jgi:hypothetical protein
VKATPERTLVDKILTTFDSSNARSWPTVREIQIELGKASVEETISAMPPGAIYIEGDRYCLSLLGMLQATRGAEIEKLLVRYLDYWRGLVRRNPRRAFVQSNEIRPELGLDAEQSRRLSQALLLGNLWSGEHRPGGAEHWTAGVPREIVDIMDVADLHAFVRDYALRQAVPIAVARGWRPKDQPSEAEDVNHPRGPEATVTQKSPASVPSAYARLGPVFGAATLIFFMGIVVAAIAGHEVPHDSRMLVVTVFALGVGLSASFIGGTAIARGRLPIPMLERHPLVFSTSGGIGAVVLMFVLGYVFYARGEPTPVGLRLESFHLESLAPEAKGLAVDTDTLRLTWNSQGTTMDVQVALENVQTGRRTTWERVASSEGSLLFAPSAYRDLLAERERGAFNRVRAVVNAGEKTWRSQEFNLLVGLTVMAYVRPESSDLCISALIDDSAVQGYDFEARAAIWTKSPSRPHSVGGPVHTTTCFSITDLRAIRWDNVRLGYLGPDDSRVVRTTTLIDVDAINRAVLHFPHTDPRDNRQNVAIHMLLDVPQACLGHTFYFWSNNRRLVLGREVRVSDSGTTIELALHANAIKGADGRIGYSTREDSCCSGYLPLRNQTGFVLSCGR